MTCKGHVRARVITFKTHITFFVLFSEFSNTGGLQNFRAVQQMVHYTCVTVGFAERCHDPDDSHLYIYIYIYMYICAILYRPQCQIPFHRSMKNAIHF